MACNPTVQYNDFTGNGSTTQFTFTFPYDNTTDVHVRLGTYPNYTYPAYGTGTTEYQVDAANPTRIVFGTAPSGPIRIFRCTPNNVLPATFQAGSSIRSSDLNNNFNQILFVSQDASIRSVDAQAVADTAYTQSNTAISTANTALSTAQTAEANSVQAVNTANTASTNATNAVNTANTASTNATAAVNTANTASTNASNAVTTSNAADANATTALNNSRESDGSGGFNSAISIANSASTIANAAQTAVANSVIYDPIANVSSIPGSPSNDTYIEVLDSTGIQSFSPLSGLPSGFVGASGLTVRLRYQTNTWTWQMYFANDAETRYLKIVDESHDLKGGSTDRIFLETDTTVSASYTITSNKNSMAIGPLTFSSGATVTVSNTSTLLII